MGWYASACAVQSPKTIDDYGINDRDLKRNVALESSGSSSAASSGKDHHAIEEIEQRRSPADRRAMTGP